LSSGSAQGATAGAQATGPSRITLRNVLIAGVSQAIIGVVIIHFTRPLALATIAHAAVPTLQGAAVGLAVGVGTSLLQIAGIAGWRAWRRFLAQATGRTPLSTAHIVAIGVVAGITEELLFRAAIQPLAGITVTSLIFAAVHWNYAALRGGREGILLSMLAFATIFAISVVLGLLYQSYGLGAAMVAHAVYDVIVLLAYRQWLGGARDDPRVS
jgi:membrane protease YdiL (CAAX protease family)